MGGRIPTCVEREVVKSIPRHPVALKFRERSQLVASEALHNYTCKSQSNIPCLGLY